LKNIYIIAKSSILLLVAVVTSCSKGFFEKYPLDAVSDNTFWNTENDALLALMGCYNTGAFWKGEDFKRRRILLYLVLMAGDGSEKELIPDRVTDGTLNSAYGLIASYWANSYQKIAECNNFLDHIDKVSMDETEKEIIVAEVRTLRAYA